MIIHDSPEIRCATTSLFEEAAVDALGGFFNTPRIKNPDLTIRSRRSHLFYGFDLPENTEIIVDNSAGTFTLANEWRNIPVTLYHYDRVEESAVETFAGIIVDLQPVGTEARITLGTHNATVLKELLPFAVINPKAGSPFETSATPNAPAPVIYGSNVPIRPPSAANGDAKDPETGEPIGTVEGYEFIVGYGAITVRSVNVDNNRDKPGFEKLGAFVTAPGSPVYVSSTRFSVTGQHAARFYRQDDHGAGTHIRFKTTAGGSAFLYSSVKAYHAVGTTPHEVEIEDELFDAGLSDVEIAGDYLVNRDGYLGITDGLYPDPGGGGADFTAIRLFDQEEGGVYAIVDNPAFPPATTSIADIIEDILTNAIYGLSVRTPQTVNAASFAAAADALDDANLTGAVAGALGYDQQQREAQGPLGELLMMRGMGLSLNADDEHVLTVDELAAAPSITFSGGPGPHAGPRLKRILKHGKRSLATDGLEGAIRNVILHWLPLGRAQASGQKFTPREYGRISKAACSGVGRDLHIFSQWIREAPIAEYVVFYVAEKLKGADEYVEVLVGVEGRDLQIGQKVGIVEPSDGITGTWQIAAMAKSLGEVTLECFQVNDTAYGEPTGVETTDAPTETSQRTSPGGGSNLLSNPSFGAPYQRYGGGVYYMPHGWNGTVPEVYGSRSAALRAQTVGGDYIEFVVDADQDPNPASAQYIVSGNYSSPSTPTYGAGDACPPNTELMASAYVDHDEDVTMHLELYEEWGSPTNLENRMLQVTVDPTDTSPAGWPRWYGRTRSGDTHRGCKLYILPTKAGTYRADAAMVEPVTVSGRKPSIWKRHKPPAERLEESEVVEFDGSTSYTLLNLIPSGAEVIGVVVYVEEEITLGTATGFDIGTLIQPDAWGSGVTITQVNEQTGPEDFIVAHPLYHSTATNVILQFNGTVTAGVVRVTVQYKRAAPAAGS